MKKSVVFLGTFLVALIIQSIIWQNFIYLDKQLWIDETGYIRTVHPEAFNKFVGYGHPGGPPVVIAIIANELFNVSYENGLAGGIALLNALSIAACALLCYVLRPKTVWWLAAAGMLTVNRLYPGATPPSAVITPLMVCIFLIGLYLYERASHVRWPIILAFGAAIGVATATRADITPAMTVPLLLLLVTRIGWKNIGLTFVWAAIFFTLTNPFMWIMSPLQHLIDLFFEIHYHYLHYQVTRMPMLELFLIAPFAMISMVLGCIHIIYRKRIPRVTPIPFLLLMLVVTIGLSIIFLTARSQAPRYFFPLIFLWETFLPLFILQLIPSFKFDFLHAKNAQAAAKRLMATTLITLLLAGQGALLIHLYFLPEIIFVCPNKQNRWLFCKATSAHLW